MRVLEEGLVGAQVKMDAARVRLTAIRKPKVSAGPQWSSWDACAGLRPIGNGAAAGPLICLARPP